MKSTVIKLSFVLAFSASVSQEISAKPKQQTGYVPGLGEIMGQTAMRHLKLWFAGQSKNWALAAYELDELHEGLEDAGKYHPTHKNIKQPIPQLLSTYMNQPLENLEKAVKEKDLERFNQHYNELTAGCNACHQATDFGFNQVIQPQHNPFANQLF